MPQDETEGLDWQEQQNPDKEAVQTELRQAVSQVVRARVNSDEQAQAVMGRVEAILKRLADHVYIQTDWVRENWGL